VTAIAAARVESRRILKHAYDVVRRLSERFLHRRRHLAALARLVRANRPRTILVVCYGNVCRSPYLQAVLQGALPDLTVVSAGFHGSDRPVPQASVTLSAKRGVDLSRFRSRPLTQSIVNSAELVIVMDSDQARQMTGMFRVNPGRIVIAGDLDPMFGATRAITDPWNQSEDVYESSFNRLDRCAGALVTALQVGNVSSADSL
jgi:protein-tyrosine phosphatase